MYITYDILSAPTIRTTGSSYLHEDTARTYQWLGGELDWPLCTGTV
jgi:hypothetical protein